MPKRGESFTGWRTPRAFFDYLDKAVGGFAVDAAADESNHLCEHWLGPGSSCEDALSLAIWPSPAFCNPPYGSGIEAWLKKFIEQGREGVEIVAVLPARTEVRWWADLVVPHADIMFLIGRLPFEHPDGRKTQPDHGSALVFYGPNVSGRVDWLDWKAKLTPQKDARRAA